MDNQLPIDIGCLKELELVMKKGLIMSAVMLALSGTASASLTGATYATANLSAHDVEHCASSNCNTIQKFQEETAVNINAIHKEIVLWKQLYKEIDRSENPDMYFDKENMQKLNDAELFVSSSEEILRIQSETFTASLSDNADQTVVKLIRSTRIAVAKLRMAIENVAMIEKQLRSSKQTAYQAKFDMNPQALASLKNATVSTYFH